MTCSLLESFAIVPLVPKWIYKFEISKNEKALCAVTAYPHKMEEREKKYYSKREKKVILQRLLSTSAHLGYQGPPTLYYQRYLYGFRNKRAIIDLGKTLFLLKIACNMIRSIIRKGGHLLLVNTDPLCANTMKRMAKKTNQSYINSKWIGGFLTNWEHMKHEERFKSSSTWHSSPRFLKMQRYFEGLITRQIPDGLVLLNARRDFYAIFEANRLRIPIVSLVDSILPEELHRSVTHPIPVNNDSIWFTNLFCQLVIKTVIHSKKARRLSKKVEGICEGNLIKNKKEKEKKRKRIWGR